MERQKIESFDKLNDRDKIISPIDKMVMEYRVNEQDGEKYLVDNKSAYPYFQFDANDWYYYSGSKEVGEIDKEYFNQ